MDENEVLRGIITRQKKANVAREAQEAARHEATKKQGVRVREAQTRIDEVVTRLETYVVELNEALKETGPQLRLGDDGRFGKQRGAPQSLDLLRELKITVFQSGVRGPTLHLSFDRAGIVHILTSDIPGQHQISSQEDFLEADLRPIVLRFVDTVVR
jgi:hypothetical protein